MTSNGPSAEIILDGKNSEGSTVEQHDRVIVELPELRGEGK